MTEVTAQMVKDLREKTGAGMMDCKKALAETNGNMEEAFDWLRKKGLSIAAKKSSRVAAEGLVCSGVSADGKKGSIIEVNSETDFVARNTEFQAFLKNLLDIQIQNGLSIEDLANSAYPGKANVTEALTGLVAIIGENMTMRRTENLSVSQGTVVSYIHNAAAPGLGKIGVLVALESAATDKAKLETLGKQLAMHVAAAKPQALDIASVSPESLARERAILIEQAQGSGKPMEIIEKMVEGRVRKFYEEVVLLEQVFVIDGETRISKLLENAGKDMGAPVQLKAFVRYELGEGIEKATTDFAAEVAAQLAG